MSPGRDAGEQWLHVAHVCVQTLPCSAYKHLISTQFHKFPHLKSDYFEIYGLHSVPVGLSPLCLGQILSIVLVPGLSSN